jgi:hypothetical protein
MFPPGENFDTISQRIAEVVEDTLALASRPRERRVEIARRQIRHAMSLAFRLGVERGSRGGASPENESPPGANRRASE